MMAKTNWKMDDTVQPADLNQIGEEINKNTSDIASIQQELEHLDLSAENVTLDSPDFVSTNVKDGMQELFTNVVNGKNEIAGAINDMNQPASGSDPFSELAQKIRDISSDATATAGDILSGQTAYARGQRITGTRVRRTGHVNAQSISRSGTSLRLRPQAGDYDGTIGNSVQITHPTIAPENIKAGVNFANSGLVGILKQGTPQILDRGIEIIPFELGYASANASNSIRRLSSFIEHNASLDHGQEAGIVTRTTVDLTDIKYVLLYHRIPPDFNVYFICSTVKDGNYSVYDYREWLRFTDGYTGYSLLDVSNLLGNYYVRMHIIRGSSGPPGKASATHQLTHVLTIGYP